MTRGFGAATCAALAAGLLIAGCGGSSADQPSPSPSASASEPSTAQLLYDLTSGWCRSRGPGVYPNYGASEDLRCDAEGQPYLRYRDGGSWVAVPRS